MGQAASQSIGQNARAGQSITIVTGLPRSGTSLMMKMLEAGGLPPLVDHLRQADVDNPQGYYEFERVKQIEKGDGAWLGEAQGKAVKVISALLKHLPNDYHYRVIFMERAMDEVLASQRKMLAHRNESGSSAAEEARMGQIFARHVEESRRWLAAQPNITTLYIHYGQLLQDAPPHIHQLQKFLKQPLNAEQMLAAIDPALYRNRV